jgi:uncharacterized damage-inducible protein DinB
MYSYWVRAIATMRDVNNSGENFRCAILCQKWQGIEREKAALLNSLNGWRDEELTWKRSANEWSVVQVLDHIVVTEEAVYSESRRVFAKARKHPTRLERLRFALLERAFRTSVRVKVPRAVAFLHPSTDIRLDNVLSRWEVQQAQWRDFLRLQDCAAAKCTAIRHPIVGDLSLANAVAFMLSHMIHHRHQLRRIRRRLVNQPL